MVLTRAAKRALELSSSDDDDHSNKKRHKDSNSEDEKHASFLKRIKEGKITADDSKEEDVILIDSDAEDPSVTLDEDELSIDYTSLIEILYESNPEAAENLEKVEYYFPNQLS